MKESHYLKDDFFSYVKTANSVVLDYSVDVIQLQDSDFILDYGELGNFSVAGFEMKLRRHVSHYLITYYLPSGIKLSETIKNFGKLREIVFYLQFVS